MLSNCNKCRTSRDIKLKVDNPKGLKLTKAAIKKNEIKVEPVCTTCGTVVNMSTFSLQNMIDKHDVMPEATRSSKAKCHACQSNQEVKLDHEENPRCMRCGGVVKLTRFMVKAMKEELKLFMSDAELEKWALK